MRMSRLTKKDWEDIIRRKRYCLFVGISLSLIAVVCKGFSMSLSALLLFVGGLLIGFSGLDDKLAEEYEFQTKEKW